MQRWSSERWTLVFAGLGHAYVHMFTAFYFTIVLALEDVWNQPYHTLIALWTPGSILVGLAALPSGWLADRWSKRGMMIVFFVGMGASSIAASFADASLALLLGLSGIGLFAAIYHPVGIPLVIGSAKTGTGKILAVNGIFGGLGVASAALVAGALSDAFGWRAAFFVPGALALITGGVMLALAGAGRLREAPPAAPGREEGGSRDDRLRAALILLFAMFISGIVFQSMQTATPKLFDLRLGALVGDTTFGVGLLVALVYGVSSFAQLLGGHLADRWRLKSVYLLTWSLQAPLLIAVAYLGGPGLVLLVTVVVSLNTGSLPAENMMLARFTPSRHHGLAFGVKFVISFGTAPLAIELIAFIEGRTGLLDTLFLLLAALALAVTLVATRLPDPRPQPVGMPAGAGD